METNDGCCCPRFMNNFAFSRIFVENMEVDIGLSTEIHFLINSL